MCGLSALVKIVTLLYVCCVILLCCYDHAV